MLSVVVVVVVVVFVVVFVVVAVVVAFIRIIFVTFPSLYLLLLRTS